MTNTDIDKIKDINKSLKNQIDNITTTVTKFQKSNHQNEATQFLLTIYTYLFWSYGVVIICLAIIMYLYWNISFYMKLFILVICIIYPFGIYTIQKYIYSIFNFIYSMLTSQIYSNTYVNLY